MKASATPPEAQVRRAGFGGPRLAVKLIGLSASRGGPIPSGGRSAPKSPDKIPSHPARSKAALLERKIRVGQPLTTAWRGQ